MDQLIVLLVDRKHGHFYRYDMGTSRLVTLEEVRDDVPRPTKSASWAGLADDKIARHIEQHWREHFKRVASRLDYHLGQSRRPDAHILLAGPEDDLTIFTELLRKPTHDRIIGMIHPDHYAGVKELEVQIIAAIAKVAQARIGLVLADIDNHRGPNGRGVVGVEPVYEALNLKQVQTLLLNPQSVYPGLVCPQDGSLSQSSDRCPTCLGALEPKPDVKTEMKQLAAAQDATVLEATDADQLAQYGHLVALRRFTD